MNALPLSPNPGRWRSVLIQLGVLAALALMVSVALRVAMGKIGAQQTATGFGFLGTTSGFDISESFIAYDATMSYGRAILSGLLNTLVAALIAGVLATIIGLAVGLARLSSNFMLRNVMLAISELIRNVPLLLQLIVWYALVINLFPATREAEPTLGVIVTNRGVFFPSIAEVGKSQLSWILPVAWIILCCGYIVAMRSPKFADRAPHAAIRAVFWALTLGLLVCWIGVVQITRPALDGFNIQGGVSISPEMTALVLGLAIYSGAFIGEVIRSGILSVPQGQVEAAYAIGLSPYHRMRRVVLPQALRLILPPLSNVYLSLAKSTSLGVAIGFPDLSSVIGTTINQSGQAIEGVLIQVAAYLAISLLVWGAVALYDRRTKYVVR